MKKFPNTVIPITRHWSRRLEINRTSEMSQRRKKEVYVVEEVEVKYPGEFFLKACFSGNFTVEKNGRSPVILPAKQVFLNISLVLPDHINSDLKVQILQDLKSSLGNSGYWNGPTIQIDSQAAALLCSINWPCCRSLDVDAGKENLDYISEETASPISRLTCISISLHFDHEEPILETSSHVWEYRRAIVDLTAYCFTLFAYSTLFYHIPVLRPRVRVISPRGKPPCRDPADHVDNDDLPTISLSLPLLEKFNNDQVLSEKLANILTNALDSDPKNPISHQIFQVSTSRSLACCSIPLSTAEEPPPHVNIFFTALGQHHC